MNEWFKGYGYERPPCERTSITRSRVFIVLAILALAFVGLCEFVYSHAPEDPCAWENPICRSGR